MKTISRKLAKILNVVSWGVFLTFTCGHDSYAAPYFFFERPITILDLSYEIEDERRRGPFIDADQKTDTSRQKLDIRTRGWAYHPAFLIFSLGLKPEFKQQTLETNTGPDQDDDSDFLGYFVDMTFLQLKPYTFNLFASEDRSDFKSSLAPDYITESSVQRGMLLLKYPTLPTTITIESRETVSENSFRTLDAYDSVRVDSRHNTANSKTLLKVESREQEREIEGSGSTTDRLTALISNTYRFSGKSNLFSTLNFRENRTEQVDTTTTASTRLDVRHRPNFSTRYDLRLETRDEEDFFSDKVSASIGLSHVLYENLTTSFNVNVTESDVTGGELDSYGAALNLRYRRRIPQGHLNMNLGLSKRVDDDKRDVVFAEVRNELHTLSGTTSVFLENANVDVGSIVVTDLAENIIYVEGIDYVVSVFGTSTAIARTLLGGIADGQQVLVDYRFVPDPAAKTSTTTNTFGVDAQLWSMLRLYYSRSHSQEEFISGIPPEELTDDTVQRIGGELRWKWSATKVEFEDRDTTRTPTQRWFVQETLLFRPRRNLSVGFGADYSELELKDTGEVEKGSGMSADLRWNVGRTGHFSVHAFTQRVRGAAQRTEREGISSVYEWRYGAWRPEVRYTLLDEADRFSGESRRRTNLLFQVKRTFR